MSFFDNITSYITDRSKRLSAKATVIILAIAAILLMDNISGFSFYYNKQRQLEQLKSITELLKDTTLSSNTRIELIILEQQTLNRKNIVDYSFSLFKNLTLISSKSNQNAINNNRKSSRNDLWFFISSSGIYLLVVILAIPIIFLTDKKTPIFRLIATMLISALIIAFTAWFNYWLFGVIIPDQLFGSWIWNYIVNFLLQIGLGVGLYWAGRYKPQT